VLRPRSYEAGEGQKRNLTEVVVTMLRLLRPPKNGNGPKSAESSKPAEPVDESDNPFNEPASVTANQDIPF
jgi:single-stranded DNA-binding protein